MNGLTHERGRDTTTLLLIPYVITSISGMGYNILEKMAIVGTSLILVHSFSEFGTKLPDYDQNENALPITHKSYVEQNWKKMYYDFCVMVHRILKMQGATHRSHHTHSVDKYWYIFGIPAFLIKWFLYQEKGDIIYFILHIELLAIAVAGTVHCILDMFNHKGARWFTWQKKPTNLLPNQIRILGWRPFKNFGNRKFETMGRTGGDYEEWFRKKLNQINKVAFFFMQVSLVLTLFDYSLWDVLKLGASFATGVDVNEWFSNLTSEVKSWLGFADDSTEKIKEGVNNVIEYTHENR